MNKQLLPYKPQQQGCPSKMGCEKVPHFASVFLFQDKECHLLPSPADVWAVAMYLPQKEISTCPKKTLAAGYSGTQGGPRGSCSFPKRSPPLEHPVLSLSLCNTRWKSLHTFSIWSILIQKGAGRTWSLPKGN